jgi:hypothetical protein
VAPSSESVIDVIDSHTEESISGWAECAGARYLSRGERRTRRLRRGTLAADWEWSPSIPESANNV